jgi:predicted TIM-barrel fold metal-dependent hydrolase
LIIAHLFGLELFIKENLTWENLYFDLSSSYLVSTKRLMKALNLFGVEHLLLGSDTPYGKNNLQKNIDRINRLDIPDNDKKLILGENLSRLLMK